MPWLSKRLDRPLKVPALGAQGYELVGGRLLPGDTGARAQFIYQNGAGQRITLYLGALAPSSPRPAGKNEGGAPQSKETTLAAPATARSSFYAGRPCARLGQMGALAMRFQRAAVRGPNLLALVTAVYQQLNP